jgi:hypothetical protein
LIRIRAVGAVEDCKGGDFGHDHIANAPAALGIGARELSRLGESIGCEYNHIGKSPIYIWLDMVL